jgi:hypothetical protein
MGVAVTKKEKNYCRGYLFWIRNAQKKQTGAKSKQKAELREYAQNTDKTEETRKIKRKPTPTVDKKGRNLGQLDNY